MVNYRVSARGVKKRFYFHASFRMKTLNVLDYDGLLSMLKTPALRTESSPMESETCTKE
jgi:hypothetical protein